MRKLLKSLGILGLLEIKDVKGNPNEDYTKDITSLKQKMKDVDNNQPRGYSSDDLAREINEAFEN